MGGGGGGVISGTSCMVQITSHVRTYRQAQIAGYVHILGSKVGAAKAVPTIPCAPGLTAGYPTVPQDETGTMQAQHVVFDFKQKFLAKGFREAVTHTIV